MSQRRVGILILAFLSGVVLVYVVVLPIYNPLRRSKERIAESILELTPIGSTREEVQAVVKEHGWQDASDPELRPQELRAILGIYSDLGLRILVDAVWEFDDVGRLRTLRVKKRSLDAS